MLFERLPIMVWSSYKQEILIILSALIDEKPRFNIFESRIVVTECPATLKSEIRFLSIPNPSQSILNESGLSPNPPPEKYS